MMKLDEVEKIKRAGYYALHLHKKSLPEVVTEAEGIARIDEERAYMRGVFHCCNAILIGFMTSPSSVWFDYDEICWYSFGTDEGERPTSEQKRQLDGALFTLRMIDFIVCRTSVECGVMYALKGAV